MPDYETGEVVLEKGSTEADKLSGAGDCSVTFTVKNNTLDGTDGKGMSLEQFVAVYDANGVLYKIFSTQKTIKKTGLNKPYTPVTTSFDVPGSGYTAEFFVFDSRSTLNIVGNPNPHTVFAD